MSGTSLPNRLGGRNRAEQFANQLLDYVREHTITDVPNAMVQHGRVGTALIPLDELAGGGATGLQLRYYEVQSIGADHLVGRTCEAGADGRPANRGTSDVVIAKQFRLRKTPFHNKTWNGISYVYSSNVERVATSGTTVETQVVTPPWLARVGDTPGDMILAVTGLQGVGALGLLGVLVNAEPVVWVTFGDGRAWARKSGT